MFAMIRSIITGTGSYIPPVIVTNKDFASHLFYSKDYKPMSTAPEEIVKKFTQITGISERRYTGPESNASDIGTVAATNALLDSNTDFETIDHIIVAQNFGNVIDRTIQTDAVPTLASRIKHNLCIRNPACVAYDILFGCPGWVQGFIQADAFFKAGISKKALVIGTETLSRVIDQYDRDSMIFSDGAGAAVVECSNSGESGAGLLSSSAQTYALEEIDFINMGASYFPGSDLKIRYIKMMGRKVYEFAITYVPAAMKKCLEKAGVDIGDLKMIFIHQANAKMDEVIISRFYQLYGMDQVPKRIMPMSIDWLGNSSVATIPTLLDLVRKNQISEYHLNSGDIILFASVGAGMNVNAICYRC
jgi:3-oxoacyl-[acyl-carrier-protein] synthase III